MTPVWRHRHRFSWGRYSSVPFFFNPHQTTWKIFRHSLAANESGSLSNRGASHGVILLVIFNTYSTVSSNSQTSSPSSVINSSPFWLSIKCICTSNSKLKTARQHLACCHAESGAPPNKQRVCLRDSSKIRKNCQRVLQIIHLSRTRNTTLTVCTSVWGLDYPKYESNEIIDISRKIANMLDLSIRRRVRQTTFESLSPLTTSFENCTKSGCAQKRIGTRNLINHWLLLWEVNQLVCFSELRWEKMPNSDQKQELSRKQISRTPRWVSLSPAYFH